MWVQATLPTRSPNSLIGHNNNSVSFNTTTTTTTTNHSTPNQNTTSEDTTSDEQESVEVGDNLNQDSTNDDEKKELTMEQLRKVILSIEQQAKVVKQEQLILLELIEQRTQLEATLAKLTSASSVSEESKTLSDSESLPSSLTPASAAEPWLPSASLPKQIFRTNTTKTLSSSTPSLSLYEQQRQARKSVDANTAGYLKANLSLFSQLFATSTPQVIAPSSSPSSEKSILPTIADVPSPTLSTNNNNNRDTNKQSRKNRMPASKTKKKNKSSEVLISREASTTSLLGIDNGVSTASAVISYKKEESLEEKRERTRKSVIREFYTTETDYVKDLTILLQVCRL